MFFLDGPLYKFSLEKISTKSVLLINLEMTTRSCLIRFDINYVSITQDRNGCGSKNYIGKVENGFEIYGIITKHV